MPYQHNEERKALRILENTEIRRLQMLYPEGWTAKQAQLLLAANHEILFGVRKTEFYLQILAARGKVVFDEDAQLYYFKQPRESYYPKDSTTEGTTDLDAEIEALKESTPVKEDE
jgi:hypothetical protein